VTIVTERRQDRGIEAIFPAQFLIVVGVDLGKLITLGET
jgi:hypothetical protein